jgi:peptidoglycan/xylan/chitin deacetylase (PgdA/CDA1 family)
VKVIGASLLVVLSLAIAGIAGIRAWSPRYTSEPELTFAQFTDAHFLDSGWRRPEQPDLSGAENGKALRWSIDRINALSRRGKQIDFVVYTGDLGLQRMAFPDSNTCLKGGGEPGTREIVAELDRLRVRTIFFVLGNEDSADDEAVDGRFDCFLLGLQERAQTLDRPLRILKLESDHCFAMKGFHLLRLNGESPSDRGLLKAEVASGTPTLLFTHITGMRDPLRLAPPWDREARVLREWEGEARQPNVLGIFVGHLHDSNPVYGVQRDAGLAVHSSVAAKTYLPPPLAFASRTGRSKQARGFLLVTANRTGVTSAEVQWF